jgi:hypothetical protein
MVDRYRDAGDRLEAAATRKAVGARSNDPFYSPEFLAAWHAHYDEEGAAISGQITYAGCVVMLASNALTRFKDDLDCPEVVWQQRGRRFGGHSAGEILIASANGFRHADEWAKTRPMLPRQLKSAAIIDAALGPPRELSVPGRCQEVIELFAEGTGFHGFSGAMLGFAHEVATACRPAGPT